MTLPYINSSKIESTFFLNTSPVLSSTECKISALSWRNRTKFGLPDVWLSTLLHSFCVWWLFLPADRPGRCRNTSIFPVQFRYDEWLWTIPRLLFMTERHGHFSYQTHLQIFSWSDQISLRSVIERLLDGQRQRCESGLIRSCEKFQQCFVRKRTEDLRRRERQAPFIYNFINFLQHCLVRKRTEDLRSGQYQTPFINNFNNFLDIENIMILSEKRKVFFVITRKIK